MNAMNSHRSLLLMLGLPGSRDGADRPCRGDGSRRAGRAAPLRRPDVHALGAGSRSARQRARRPRWRCGRSPARSWRRSSSGTSCRRSDSSRAWRRSRRNTSRSSNEVLEGMRQRRNLRVHFVGHADTQPLSPALVRVFEDNAGLSRERAGEVAEYFKTALDLPPEAISYEWAGDTQPIASNASAEGRALNRRVEVEVWYDEASAAMRDEEVVVAEDIRRVKVCRMETVCKMRYLEGHARRARVRNLIVPLRYDDETAAVPEAFTAQVRQALDNLRDRQNVTVRFIGHTDDVPLTGRNERIYGDHLSLSQVAGAPRRPRHPGLDRPAGRRGGKRRPRRDAADRLERDRAGARAEPARRGGVLVRRSAPGAARRAAALPGRGRRRDGDESLRPALGPDRAARACARPAGDSAGLRVGPPSRACRTSRAAATRACASSASRRTSASTGARPPSTATTSGCPRRARAGPRTRSCRTRHWPARRPSTRGAATSNRTTS